MVLAIGVKAIGAKKEPESIERIIKGFEQDGFENYGISGSFYQYRKPEKDYKVLISRPGALARPMTANCNTFNTKSELGVMQSCSMDLVYTPRTHASFMIVNYNASNDDPLSDIQEIDKDITDFITSLSPESND